MTDRELLENAAKAAGLTCVWSPSRPDYESNQEQQPIYWNPLEDDGEALRLAGHKNGTASEHGSFSLATPGEAV